MNTNTLQKLRLVFYGDDFTGSTDALEVLTAAGMKCALFLAPPSLDALQALGEFDAIGIAGDSRSMSPAEMDKVLPQLFDAINSLSPALVHYKVCSTFDSSPDVGSIGHVIDLARKTFSGCAVPVIAGNPALARYCIFGNLYALSKTDHVVHRIDRHPVMSVHPITPMHEADLSLHINEQHPLSFAKVDICQLDGQEDLEGLVAKASIDHDAILFDGATPDHLTSIGGVLTGLAEQKAPVFLVGSSGVEYALTQYWQTTGNINACQQLTTALKPASQVLVVSGSASPLSHLQIDYAVEHGFVELAVDAAALLSQSEGHAASRHLVASVLSLLERGLNVIIHTAKGPKDQRIDDMIASMVSHGTKWEEAKIQGGKRLAVELGAIVKNTLETYPLKRLVISGGDTSSQITKALAPDALEIKSYLSPGAPLCRVISDKPYLSGLEIALKGGQMGESDYFVKALRGDPGESI
jgi:uncharacterized protein YgbK (DUF1537 family)